MAKLNKTDFQLQFKKGLEANIDIDATKYLAVQGEPHWTTDGKNLYIFDGTDMQFIGGNSVIRSKSVYTGTDTTDDVYVHICDSASAFTLTVTDGSDDGEEIKVINRGAGTVTLSGNISTVTATTTLYEGETIVLCWDSSDSEWQ